MNRETYKQLCTQWILESKQSGKVFLNVTKNNIQEGMLMDTTTVDIDKIASVDPIEWQANEWHYRKHFHHPIDSGPMKVIYKPANFSTGIQPWEEPTRKWLEYT
jgi:hypothetical protein